MNHIYQKSIRNPRDWQTMRLTKDVKNPYADGRKKIGGGQFPVLKEGTLWEVFHESIEEDREWRTILKSHDDEYFTVRFDLAEEMLPLMEPVRPTIDTIYRRTGFSVRTVMEEAIELGFVLPEQILDWALRCWDIREEQEAERLVKLEQEKGFEVNWEEMQGRKQ